MQALLTLFLLISTLFSVVNASPIIETRPARRSYSVNDPDLPPAVRLVCAGGANATTVTNSTSFGTSGVTITTGVCSPPSNGDSNPEPVSVPGAVTHPSCPTALNNCVSRFGTDFSGNGYVSKCGAPCSSSCYPGSGGPNPYDCATIFNSLFSHSPQLFVLNPNNFLLLSYGSCGTGIQNQIASSSIGCSQTMIYDYTDWAGIGNYLAFNCQAQQGARGGKCTGNTGLYQTGTPDYYVQVYAN